MKLEIECNRIKRNVPISFVETQKEIHENLTPSLNLIRKIESFETPVRNKKFENFWSKLVVAASGGDRRRPAAELVFPTMRLSRINSTSVCGVVLGKECPKKF